MFHNPTTQHISRENHNSKRYMHCYIQCSSLYNSQDREATKMSINRGMDKEYVYIYTRNFFFFLVSLGLYLQHMESPRLAIKSELQLLAYIAATAMPDPSGIWDLYCSPWQRRILNPLGKARDQTHVLMDISQVCYH